MNSRTDKPIVGLEPPDVFIEFDGPTAAMR